MADKKWYEYIVDPMLSGLGMGFVSPVMNLFGLGPEQPPAPKPPEPNRLAGLLAESEEKRRQRMAQMQMQNYNAVNQPNQDVMAALERVRRNWRA